jgi:hypothetical protein
MRSNGRFWMLTVAVLVVALVAILAGCEKTTSVSSILDHPAKYMDHEVTIAGEVTKVYSAPLVIAEPGIYQVDDGTGAIWVVSEHSVPRVGSKVGLKGVVASPLKVLGGHIGAIIREDKRKVK